MKRLQIDYAIICVCCVVLLLGVIRYAEAFYHEWRFWVVLLLLVLVVVLLLRAIPDIYWKDTEKK